MFGVRLASSVVLFFLTVFFLTQGGVLLYLAIFTISIKGYLEYTKAVKIPRKNKGLNALEIVGIVGITILYVLMIAEKFAKIEFEVTYLLAITVLTITSMLFIYVIGFPKYNIAKIAEAAFGFVYIPVMLSFVCLTRNFPEVGKKVVWLIAISAWGSDTFAYCVGMITGKCFSNHKAFPVLSPKKSIEGCIGGIVGSTLLGAGFGAFFLSDVQIFSIPNEYIIIATSIIGAIGSVIAQCGDLVASAIKRNYDIKDFGNVIPGHGGIIDRFDSIIFTAPAIYFLVYILIDLSKYIQ